MTASRLFSRKMTPLKSCVWCSIFTKKHHALNTGSLLLWNVFHNSWESSHGVLTEKWALHYPQCYNAAMPHLFNNKSLKMFRIPIAAPKHGALLFDKVCHGTLTKKTARVEVCNMKWGKIVIRSDIQLLICHIFRLKHLYRCYSSNLKVICLYQFKSTICFF